MPKLPKELTAKIKSYMHHSHKAHALLAEIDTMFASIGIDTISVEDGNAHNGSAIQDVLIDASLSGEVKRTVELIEQNLEW